MELKTYLEILWRRKWIIGVSLIATMSIVVTGTLLMTPIYAASATLRVEPIMRGTQELGWDQIQYADRLVNTYKTIATSDPVLEKLKQHLDLAKLPKVDVEIPANTELMRITSEAENPIVAAQVANVLAELLVAENRKAQTRGAYNISLVDPATVPSSPSSPRTEINIAMGIIVGLIGGLGLAFLFENLDTKLYTTEQIEAIMPWSTLGYIPKAQKKQTKIMNGNSPEGEAFRRLRTSLLVSNHEVPFRVLLVTSAEPGEGKSTIVANLAYTIAQLGLSVVIVDGDLRLPTLHKIFNISNEFGLSNLLQQKITLTKAIQATCTPQVHVLTSGPRPHNPVEMLSSDQMAAIIKELRQQFDLILIDTPAVLAVTDALVLAPFVDGIIFVVGRAQAKLETVQSAQQQLDGINATPIGIVINRTSRDKNYY